jgi:hypothetical protein
MLGYLSKFSTFSLQWFSYGTPLKYKGQELILGGKNARIHRPSEFREVKICGEELPGAATS